MMAHILLEYSSDGPPPSIVDRRMRGMGLARDGAFFVLEAASEEEMRAKIDRLHDALRGSGARYTIAAEGPGNEAARSAPGARELGPMDKEAMLETRMETVGTLLRTGGRSRGDLLEAIEIDEPALEEVLQEMVDRGLITTYRQEDELSYRLAGPMLRSMAR